MVWSLMLLLGYGALLFALREHTQPPLHSYAEAFYFAGASFFTIGFGDIVGHDTSTRMLSLAAGASGFGVISTTTAYLFALFGSFQTREQFVVMVGARAGTPPSGVGMLVIAAEIGSVASLNEVMRDAQRWCATVLETHLAYPVLAYFRSSHDHESWVGTLGTVLDAAVLTITTVEGDAADAKILYAMGRHATRDLARYFRMPEAGTSPGITRHDFDRACETLAKAGYTLREREQAWKSFAELRGAYANALNSLAHFFSIPPLQWVGDRSAIRVRHHT
jgi:hypothetical protein